MFVRNGKLLLKQGMSTGGTTSVSGVGSNGTTVNIEVASNDILRFLAFGFDGNSAYYNSLYGLSNGTALFYGNNTSPSGGTYSGIRLGDGDTPVSFDDYNLSGNLITDFTASTAVSSVIDGNGNLVFTGLYTITNTGASDFTIKEIGNFRRNQYGGTSSVMISRDVLENPLTIPAGETKILRYSITL